MLPRQTRGTLKKVCVISMYEAFFHLVLAI